MRYNSAGVQSCKHATVHSQAVCTHTFTLRGTTNTSGARKETLSELMAPMYRKKRAKR